MKEYLFRGKAKESIEALKITKGDWVYGYYVKKRHNSKIKIPLIYSHDFPSSIFIPIAPKTLGIYIGIKDINKKRIYVGDILSVRDGSGLLHRYEVAEHINTGYYLISAEREADEYGCYTRNLGLANDEYRIIGNIHTKSTF